MKNKGHKLLVFLLILCIFILVGFKATELLVKDSVDISETGAQEAFIKSENIDTLEENEKSSLILKDDTYYRVPKDALIRTTRDSQSYEATCNTLVLDKPKGNEMRMISAGEVLILQKLDGEYGLFLTTTDKIYGYVYLNDLQVNILDSITYGIAKVDRVLKNESSYYVLAKNEIVKIKSYKDNKFIIVNDNDAEFIANDTDIEVRGLKEQVSRSAISRRTKDITKVITSAYNKIGSPYVYGDIGKRGYDCSGFTYSIFFNDLGIKLPRSSNVQVNAGTKITKSELVPGDILFFNTTGKGISHVGLYIGDGNMIHASSGKMKVRIDNINSGYYSKRYVTARRIVN